jgi:drug/metabolite transporter (DMT)-like permease
MMGVLAALWGASYMFIKVALDDVSEPFIVFSRTLLATAVLAPLAIRSDAFAALRGRWRWVVVVAVVQIAAPFLLITFGENHISSSMAGILVSSAPIFTALIAIRFDHEERSHGWALVGVVTGILGVGLLFGVDLSTEATAVAGGLMVLLASFGYAAGALTMKARLGDAQPVGLAAATMGVSTLLTAPFAAASLPGGAGADTIGSLIVLGAGGTGIAFLLFYTLIADVGPARASIVAYLAPVFSVIYGVALLDEGFSVASAAGLLLILAGSWLGAEARLPSRRGRLNRTEPSRSTAPAPVRVR